MTTRLRLVLLGVAVCGFAALAWWLSGIWSPTPPRSLTMATGPEGGALAVIARSYRPILARAGVDLRLRPTAGSTENLALLRDPGSQPRRNRRMSSRSARSSSSRSGCSTAAPVREWSSAACA
jgi:hypothetical protein